MSHDPYRTVLERLAEHGCSPRETAPGQAIARCPAHKDRLPSLSIADGADRRALVYCFAGCDPAAVVRALALDWPDMFPDGHRLAPRSRQPRVVNEPPIVSVLAVLGTSGIGWRATTDPNMFVADSCPACGARRLWLHADPKRVRASCWSAGCDTAAILDALEARVTGEERRAAA